MSTPPITPIPQRQGQGLFDLLPALYRLRDSQLAQTSGQSMGPLQSLLMLVDEQLALIAENLNQLYDDQFIETCANWVIPYIGDLIGYQSINGIASAVDSPRAEVASTIGFRRRKGTVPVIEQLARDATGWGAHAVEFFRVLATTQCIRNHVRLHNYYAPNLRRWKPCEYMDSGFDTTAHTVDVRRIADERGRYNIQNIGIFLWSLSAYSQTESPVTAVVGNPQCFRFSPFGADMPLFNTASAILPETTTLAQPVNVPGRLHRHVLCKDIYDITRNGGAPVYYGSGLSLALYLNGSLQDPSRIQVCDLSGTDGSWVNLPTSGEVFAVDPLLGRIATSPGVPTGPITATFYYAFNAAIAGGEYPRESTFTASLQQAIVRVPGDYAAIQDALNALAGNGVVEVSDSGTYTEAAGLTINVRANGHIELRAAEGSHPTLLLGGEIAVTGANEAAFDLNGFLIAYSAPAGGSPPAALLHVPNTSTNHLTHLGITHCTLVPGWALQTSGAPQAAWFGLPTLLVEISALAVIAAQSILGGLWINGQSTASLTDCIVDATSPSGIAYVAAIDSTTNAPSPGGALTLNGCTVVGKVYASLLSLVSDSILRAELGAADVASSPPLWNAPLWAAREQQGCVRFSFLPAGSIIPRQFQCVTQAVGSPAPMFYSLQFGNPAYAKLLPTTDPAVRQGADDGGEMGAFHFLLAPLREADLRIRLQEYIPVGMEFGIFYES
jgi:hypothetical protein